MTHQEAGPPSASPSHSTADEVDAGVGASILIVDDERPLLRVLSAGLEAKGYRTRTALTGAKALEAAAVAEPDVTLLDLGLPDLDGIDVCARLRRATNNPIIVLTADGAEDRKIRALDEGADDYVTKPFSLPELLARIRVALRHRRALSPSTPGAPEVIVVGTLIIDVDAHVATLDGVELRLTRKELAVLGLLARNAGRVLTHRAILDQVWGPDQSLDTLRTHVTLLRRKLGTDPRTPQIVTAPGSATGCSPPTTDGRAPPTDGRAPPASEDRIAVPADYVPGRCRGSVAAAGTAGRVRSRAKPRMPATVLARRMPILADEVSAGSVNDSPVTNSATVKPMPAVTARPSMCRQVADVGEAADAERTASRAPPRTPIGLADDEPERDAGQHPPVERPRVEADAGVGQGEQGHDAERDPEVEATLDALQRRRGLRRRTGRGPPPRPRPSARCDRRARGSRHRSGWGRGTVGWGSAGRTRRRRWRPRRRTDAARTSRRAPSTTYGHDRADLRAAQHDGATTASAAKREPGQPHVLGVEDRDDDDAADVVDDSQGEDEDAGAERDARTGEVTTPTAKAMSVATGMPHPPAPARARVERGEDERRHDHPTERGDGGERRGAAVAQLAQDQLALDLQARQQEEQGHRPSLTSRVDVMSSCADADPAGSANGGRSMAS